MPFVVAEVVRSGAGCDDERVMAYLPSVREQYLAIGHIKIKHLAEAHFGKILGHSPSPWAERFRAKMPIRFPPRTSQTPMKTQKADVAEHPEAFDHVGLQVNEPSSPAGVLFA